jgi:hypothetical protein
VSRGDQRAGDVHLRQAGAHQASAISTTLLPATNSPSDLAADDQLAERERDEHRDSGRAAAAAIRADALSGATGRRALALAPLHNLGRIGAVRMRSLYVRRRSRSHVEQARCSAGTTIGLSTRRMCAGGPAGTASTRAPSPPV